MEIAGAITLWTVALLALIVAAAGEGGKIGNIELPGPTTRHRQAAVAGVAVVALALGFLLFEQASRSSSNTAQPTAVPTTSVGAAPAGSSVPAAESTSQPSASSQPAMSTPPLSRSSPAVTVLKQGDLTLLDGDAASLETGKSGKAVDRPDVVRSAEALSASNGRIGSPSDGATPATCRDVITRYASSTAFVELVPKWLCLTTSAGHLAAVQATFESDNSVRMHFIVWNALAS